MLTDRRPILLANARLIDPSRDLDGPGDVLIADGVIRDARRGIGAAGVPEGTDIVNCAGMIVAPGLIDMRAFVGEPGEGHRETFASRLGLVGIPSAAEAVILERDMRLVALTGGRYHAASLTCAESIEILRRARDAGLSVSASASINHLTLNENDIGPYRSFLKLSPPLRSENDRRALVEALASGLIDVVMSDHNPQDVEVKRLPFAEAAPGAVGIETMLPAALRLVQDGEMKLMTALKGPATKAPGPLGLPGGSLRPGAPAQLCGMEQHV